MNAVDWQQARSENHASKQELACGANGEQPQLGETMSNEFPSAVPEIPVTDMAASLKFYEDKLGFTVDWGRDGGGIAGISQGRSRIFLTDRTIRDYFRNEPPVVVWLNLDSKQEVNELYERWKRNGAAILRPPESNPAIRLHEFRIADPDGNLIRAFFTF